MANEPLLGAHVSAAGGAAVAIERGRAIDCRALQIFVKSPNQWNGAPLADGAVRDFREARGASSIGPVVAHAAYLVNLAAPDGELRSRSIAALVDELDRSARLGLDGLVVHPGSHGGAGVDEGIDRVARAVEEAYSRAGAAAPPTLLELTAGQGHSLGRRLEELAAIRDRSAARDRIAFCLDTCHAFAAGYAIDTPEGLAGFLEETERLLGFALVACVHINDSIGARGSRRDRHANLGKGEIGLDTFVRLARDPRLAKIPLILETPLGEDERGHARDLARLRRALAATPDRPVRGRATSKTSASKGRTRSR